MNTLCKATDPEEVEKSLNTLKAGLLDVDFSVLHVFVEGSSYPDYMWYNEWIGKVHEVVHGYVWRGYEPCEVASVGLEFLERASQLEPAQTREYVMKYTANILELYFAGKNPKMKLTDSEMTWLHEKFLRIVGRPMQDPRAGRRN